MWLFYGAGPPILGAAIHALGLVCDPGATPTFDLQLAVTSCLWLLFVGAAHHTQRVAAEALRRFQPVLAADEAALRKYRHALTTSPPGALLGSVLGGVVLVASVLRVDPSFFGLLTGRECLRPVLLGLGWFNSFAIVLATYLGLRYLGLIRRIHAAAPSVNLFDRGPLFAFSTLASRVALFFAAFGYGYLLVYPTSRENVAAVAYILGINLPSLLAIFVYPLYGMHVRMVEEKRRLLRDSRRKIRESFERFHAGPSTPRAIEVFHRQFPSLIEAESYLRRIPTWPWEAGTLTAVLTAILLPLVVVVLQQVLARLLGTPG